MAGKTKRPVQWQTNNDLAKSYMGLARKYLGMFSTHLTGNTWCRKLPDGTYIEMWNLGTMQKCRITSPGGEVISVIKLTPGLCILLNSDFDNPEGKYLLYNTTLQKFISKTHSPLSSGGTEILYGSWAKSIDDANYNTLVPVVQENEISITCKKSATDARNNYIKNSYDNVFKGYHIHCGIYNIGKDGTLKLPRGTVLVHPYWQQSNKVIKYLDVDTLINFSVTTEFYINTINVNVPPMVGTDLGIETDDIISSDPIFVDSILADVTSITNAYLSWRNYNESILYIVLRASIYTPLLDGVLVLYTLDLTANELELIRVPEASSVSNTSGANYTISEDQVLTELSGYSASNTTYTDTQTCESAEGCIVPAKPASQLLRFQNSGYTYIANVLATSNMSPHGFTVNPICRIIPDINNSPHYVTSSINYNCNGGTYTKTHEEQAWYGDMIPQDVYDYVMATEPIGPPQAYQTLEENINVEGSQSSNGSLTIMGISFFTFSNSAYNRTYKRTIASYDGYLNIGISGLCDEDIYSCGINDDITASCSAYGVQVIHADYLNEILLVETSEYSCSSYYTYITKTGKLGEHIDPVEDGEAIVSVTAKLILYYKGVETVIRVRQRNYISAIAESDSGLLSTHPIVHKEPEITMFFSPYAKNKNLGPTVCPTCPYILNWSDVTTTTETEGPSPGTCCTKHILSEKTMEGSDWIPEIPEDEIYTDVNSAKYGVDATSQAFLVNQLCGPIISSFPGSSNFHDAMITSHTLAFMKELGISAYEGNHIIKIKLVGVVDYPDEEEIIIFNGVEVPIDGDPDKGIPAYSEIKSSFVI